MLQFNLEHTTPSGQRCGSLHFKRTGQTVKTPVFMPVGTRASVKTLLSEDLLEMDYQLILGNTYHLHLRPGDDLVAEMGGLARFMNWPGVILTDSGGFQVYSLASLVKFQENGVQFQSHLDGSKVLFTPQSVLDIQNNLGSDIMMVLDDCPPWPCDEKRLKDSLDRTHRWARRAVEYHSEQKMQGALFGIIQGGLEIEARQHSLKELTSMHFNGFALGGLSVGEPRELFHRILAAISHSMPVDKPRYLMGVGAIPDLLEGVKQGIDMFDCVLPTRNARRGQVFTSQGKLNMRNHQYRLQDGPIDPQCLCRMCSQYSRGYIRHLFHVNEISAMRIATYHNLFFLKKFMDDMRTAVSENQFDDYYSHYMALYT